jgi:hypothetical protein
MVQPLLIPSNITFKSGRLSVKNCVLAASFLPSCRIGAHYAIKTADSPKKELSV